VKVNELTPEAQAAFQQAAQKVYPELEGKVGKEFVKTSLEFLGR
jgi:TRAP-type C4-dicarboxylate transport system substrate-binding protein